MTVMLMKLIEDVLALFRALCPCLFHDRQLLQSLTRTNKRKTCFNSTVGDPVVFIYPNMLHKDHYWMHGTFIADFTVTILWNRPLGAIWENKNGVKMFYLQKKHRCRE